MKTEYKKITDLDDNYLFDHFKADVGMVVYDLAKGVYTTDGKIWNEIEEDHL